MGESVCFCPGRLGPALPAGMACPEQWDGDRLWELCALTPEGALRLREAPLRCRTLLVPEGIFCPTWQAEQVVSYGLSHRSSLTLSSMDGQGVLCVQRRLRDRLWREVEEQELTLPESWRDYPPQKRLLLAGVWLLWGSLEQ